MFKLALIQMRVDGGNPSANLCRALQHIRKAAAAGARVILLPEAMDLGWTHPSAKVKAEPVPTGHLCTELRRAAREHALYICAGLTEQAAGRVYNAAVLLGPDGELCLHHRKLNELEIGHDLYARGDRLGVTTTPLATFGLMICAAAFAPGQIVSRTLGLMGADLILSPCAWAVPATHDQTAEPYGQLWLDNYQPVARDFKLCIAAASNVGTITGGPWSGRNCIGCSLVIGPRGETIASGPYGVGAESIIYAEVPLKT